MESRTFQLLEFPKVLGALAERAVSAPGQVACLSISPAATLEDVERRSSLLAETLAWSNESRFSLRAFPEMEGVFAFISNPANVLDTDALTALQEIFEIAESAHGSLTAGKAAERALLSAFKEKFPLPQRTAPAVKRCIDPDGRLKDESSPELFSVRSEIRSINQSCTRKVKDFVKKEGIAEFLQEDFMTISSDRYVLPLKSNFKGRIPGIIHDYSQTGETCYFEPLFLVDFNNRLQELKREEREEEHKVLLYLTNLVRQELDAVRGTYDFLVELDVLLAKAGLAENFSGIPLAVGKQGDIRLIEARHPLLALGTGKVQPLDIRLRQEEYALIISGGNAGGKTVSLKTVGLIALMAMSGLPVPVAEGSSIPYWRKIFAFVGDEQSLEESVSTFTAQIKSLSRIWSEVNNDTLVVLDEFGAGTDPTQGAALAQAVIDSLIEKRCKVVTATHFPALKAYGLTREHVRSASVIFDPETKKPLFKLAYDQIGASIALDVAREHGLPREILERAEQNLLLDGTDSSKLMNRLNELSVQKEHELEEARGERIKLKARQKKLEEGLEKEKAELFKQVQSLSQKIMRQWQEGKVERKKALKELSKAKEKLLPARKEPKQPAFDFDAIEVGTMVMYRQWGKEAKVVEKNPKRSMVKIDLGGISLWVEAADLNSARKSAPAGKPQTKVSLAPSEESSSFILDLRGKRAEQAVSEVSRFIDQAMLKGRSHLEIIHGRGTGALRKEVHEFLRTFPGIKSFSLANEEEGGDGKTLVNLA